MTENTNFKDDGIDLTIFDKDAEIAKFKNVKVVGWTLLVRLYTEPEKIGSLFMPDKVRDEGLYKNCVGLVIQKGQGVYRDTRYADTGIWCEVGDWVVFPRHSGYRIFMYGIPIWVLKEDALDIVIPDPRIVSNYKY